MAIDPRFIVSLKGRDYPTWPGILDAATRSGLKSLTTQIVQIPTPENGNLAVVMARAEFDDGRVFEDIGDCSPASTSQQLASALLRLASTRAKGRVLRDSVNVGQTLLEELPDLDDAPPAPARPAPRAQPQAGNGRQQAIQEGGMMVCSKCPNPKALTKGQYEVSLRAYGSPLCPDHQKAAAAAKG